MNRQRTLRAVGTGAILLSLLGCQPRLSGDECTALLEHYTDGLVDQARPSAKLGERRRLLDEARKRAAEDPQFSRCPDAVSRSQFECAMAAGGVDAIERCLL